MQQEWSWRKKMENCKIEKKVFWAKTSEFWQLKTIFPHFWQCPGVPRCISQKFIFWTFQHWQRPVCLAPSRVTHSAQPSDPLVWLQKSGTSGTSLIHFDLPAWLRQWNWKCSGCFGNCGGQLQRPWRCGATSQPSSRRGWRAIPYRRWSSSGWRKSSESQWLLKSSSVPLCIPLTVV